MYPFLAHDFDFNVQPKLNIKEDTHLKLTPGFKKMDEYVTEKYVASIGVYTLDEGWVDYQTGYMIEYEDSDLGCIESARWYHTQKGPYIILEYEYGKRWFGQDGTLADVDGNLPESGYHYREPAKSQTAKNSNYVINQSPRENAQKKPIVIDSFSPSDGIDFKSSPKVKISSCFVQTYNVYIYLDSGEEKEVKWGNNSGFETTMGPFLFVQWENINYHYFINLVFSKGTVRLGSNGNFQELSDRVADNRTLEPFSPKIYDLSVPPTFAIYEENNEQWYEVKALSKHKNELISICKKKMQDKSLAFTYWYTFDDSDTFIVLDFMWDFESENKWLCHNGLTAKIDPPNDVRNIRQSKWPAGTDIKPMNKWPLDYDGNTEPVILKDSTGYKIRVKFWSDEGDKEEKLLDINSIDKSEPKSASWHEYDEGLFLILIYPHKIYLVGADPEVEDELKLKYKIIRNS